MLQNPTPVFSWDYLFIHTCYTGNLYSKGKMYYFQIDRNFIKFKSVQALDPPHFS